MVKDATAKDSPLNELKRQCVTLQRMVAQRSKSLKAGVAKSKSMNKSAGTEALDTLCIACEMVFSSQADLNIKDSLVDWDGSFAAKFKGSAEKLAVVGSSRPLSLAD